jgi:hypothetical protein
MGVTPFLKTVGSAELSLAPAPSHTLSGTGANHDVSEEWKGLGDRESSRLETQEIVRVRKPHVVSFSVCPSSAVGFQTSAIGEGQLLKQAYQVDTRSDRQVPAGSTQFLNRAVAGLIEATAQARPTPRASTEPTLRIPLGTRSLWFLSTRFQLDR